MRTGGPVGARGRGSGLNVYWNAFDPADTSRLAARCEDDIPTMAADDRGSVAPPPASDAQEAEWRAKEGERLLVVGIGASAGGLEALERFLQRVPADSGLAYVVVQHLSPEHESSLADILARATKLPVVTVTDGQRVERDHVYVIPPGAGLAVEGGALRLVPFDPRGVRLLVNAFLTSLAEDQRENAVGIVLSGTGSDGALGIAAVKRHGGRTFAQVPGDARYESMPAAAIATGMVEQVLPVDEIPAALVRLAAERRHHPPESARGEAEGLRQALETVGRVTGHDFSRYKRTTILRRFHRRMAVTGTATVREYAALLEGDADEARRLAEDLTINVTSFFRDDGPFQVVEKLVIPDLLERRGAEGIRVVDSGVLLRRGGVLARDPAQRAGRGAPAPAAAPGLRDGHRRVRARGGAARSVHERRRAAGEPGAPGAVLHEARRVVRGHEAAPRPVHLHGARSRPGPAVLAHGPRVLPKRAHLPRARAPEAGDRAPPLRAPAGRLPAPRQGRDD